MALAAIFQLSVFSFVSGGGVSSFATFSVRFLAGLPIFLILVAILRAYEFAGLTASTELTLGFIFALAVATASTGTAILMELVKANDPFVSASWFLGIDATYAFWRIILLERRREVTLAVAISIVRMLAELAVLINIKEIDISLLSGTSSELLKNIAETLLQSVNISDNVLLILMIFALSLLGRVAVAGAVSNKVRSDVCQMKLFWTCAA